MHELRTRGVALRAMVQPIHPTAMRRLRNQEQFWPNRQATPGTVHRVPGGKAAAKPACRFVLNSARSIRRTGQRLAGVSDLNVPAAAVRDAAGRISP